MAGHCLGKGVVWGNRGKNEMTDTDLNGRHLSGGRGVVCSDSDGPKWPAPAK